MLERVPALVGELADVEAQLADPAVYDDPRRSAALARRHKELAEIVAVGRELAGRSDDITAARELLAEAGGADRDLARAEVTAAEADVEDLTRRLRTLLLPTDPNDARNVIVEIRGAEGGEEANLFARELFEMYRAFAARMGWSTEVLGTHASELGGLDEVTFRVAGEGAWRRLHHEGGPHRVQRVPVTESQGRIHTSSATVSVLAEAKEVDVTIDPSDLEIDVYRSSGPGGQSVNTTDSAVRVTHLPTGMVVAMQDQKSQTQNRARALAVLRSRLLAAEQARQAAEASDARRDQVGAGGRSEKIRTYNFKESRVTDHRIKLTVHTLDRVLAGELEEISDALVADEQARRLSEDPV